MKICIMIQRARRLQHKMKHIENMRKGPPGRHQAATCPRHVLDASLLRPANKSRGNSSSSTALHRQNDAPVSPTIDYR